MPSHLPSPSPDRSPPRCSASLANPPFSSDGPVVSLYSETPNPSPSGVSLSADRLPTIGLQTLVVFFSSLSALPQMPAHPPSPSLNRSPSPRCSAPLPNPPFSSNGPVVSPYSETPNPSPSGVSLSTGHLPTIGLLTLAGFFFSTRLPRNTLMSTFSLARPAPSPRCSTPPSPPPKNNPSPPVAQLLLRPGKPQTITLRGLSFSLLASHSWPSNPSCFFPHRPLPTNALPATFSLTRLLPLPSLFGPLQPIPLLRQPACFFILGNP